MLETNHAAKRDALSRARTAKKRKNLAFAEREVQSVVNDLFLEALLDILQL